MHKKNIAVKFRQDIVFPMEQAPEAGGCATGDGGYRGYRGHRGHRGHRDTGDTGDAGLTGSTVFRHDLTEIKPKIGVISKHRKNCECCPVSQLIVR